MDIDARAQAWVRLHAAALPGHALVALLRAFGSPEAILAASPRAREPYLTPAAARALAGGAPPERVEAALAWLRAPGHTFLAWDDPAFPPALLEIPDPPPLLYMVGNPAALAKPALAIVGSRNATPQGRLDAEAFAAELARAGLVIVSGLAVGIDAAAHAGALRAGAATIAVIGTGPDRVYPSRNRTLAHEIAARGVILSEFGPGTPPLPANFPRRNRLISGLARGVLVIEATLSSGSLITARMAGEQGRELFALPGSIHSPFSRGCHKLIREGAKLVETASDILEELRLPKLDVSAHTPGRAQSSVGSDVAEHPDADARMVLRALGRELLDADALVARTGLVAARVCAALSVLEIDGAIAGAAGGRWQRVD